MLGRIAAVIVCWIGFAQVADAGLPESCGQVMVVVTADWQSTGGELHRFEKDGTGWQRKGRFPVTVGHRGLAIGRGLHPAGLEGPVKREGDRRAPAGIFTIEGAFGTARMKLPHFPYRRTDGKDLWIDDPASAFYNQWLRLDDPRVRRDWKSAEVLRRDDGLYELAIIVGHNRAPVEKGAGSAIFMHRWYGPGRSTIGCTAMAAEGLRALAGWLDAEKAPVLVQAPRALLPMLGLPEDLTALLP